MVLERDVDPAALYDEERLAFVARLSALTSAELALPVPATPLWSVRDVLAHVVGITADLNAQRFGGDGTPDDWTAAQIATRRDRTVDELAAEWAAEAPAFEAGLRLFGYGFGAHYLGDLLQHTCDVETALGRIPARDDLALAVALDFYLESFESTLVDTGATAVAVDVGEELWVLGAGEPVVSVTAPRFELFRSLGGRRTRAEIAALDWRGDADVVDAVIDAVSRYPMPVTSLDEGDG
ncbi:MAG: maleylpyruvate isomerase family mycothiol-dependent enzyme [Acidimicrobiales bacterium]